MIEGYFGMPREEYHQDMELNGSGNTDHGHKLADRALRKTDWNRAFVKEVDRLKINVSDHYAERDVKEKVIRKYASYTALNYAGQNKKEGEPGRSLPECEDNQIGGFLDTTYNSSKKKIRKAFS